MARMPSTMGPSHDFARVPRAEIPRASFDRSNGYKTSFDAGQLIPVFSDEVLPGDTFALNMTAFCRLSTPLRPFMDNLFLNSFFFFVPLRLLWTNFQKFMGEQDNPGDSTSYTIPQIVAPAGGYAEQSLYDYFELPTKIAGFTHSALYLRAYNLIWNQWFRDQNLQNSIPKNMGDGPDSSADYTVQKRGKRHDYFTGALPWPQKGPGVNIPLGGNAPVTGLAMTNNSTAAFASVVAASGSEAAGDQPIGTSVWSVSAAQAMQVKAQSNAIPSGSNRPQIFADLSAATGATINQLRQAFQLQKLQERDARGGTRYTEIVQAHFNVTSPDSRLQRAEYLGGGQGMVNVHQVAQVSASVAGQTPQGNLAAYGTAQVSGHGFTKSFTEHGIIIGLISVRADINYQQGLNKRWSRSTKYDFYWPALAMIGEQAVLNLEIFTQGNANDQLVFGYQERYAEYRYKPSVVTGKLRSNAAQPLDTWHLAQNFASLPALNAAFIVDNPPIARVVAVPSEPNFIGDFWFSLRCARPMPVFGVPGLIDHF